MHPVLFHLGPMPVRAFGVGLALAFVVGSWLALRRGSRRGLDEDLLLNLFAWILGSAIVGARLYYVLLHPEQFASPLDAFRLWEGGLILYGGVAASILVTWVYLRRRQVSFLPVADVIAPSLALGEAIGRVGCFFNGCCFGSPVDGPLGVQFPSDSYAARVLGEGVRVWPSQLFLAVGLGLAFLVLLAVERRLPGKGSVFGLYLMLQGMIRYAVDWTRHYESADRIQGLGPLVDSRSQVLALLFLLVGLVLLLAGQRRRPLPVEAA